MFPYGLGMGEEEKERRVREGAMCCSRVDLSGELAKGRSVRRKRMSSFVSGEMRTFDAGGKTTKNN